MTMSSDATGLAASIDHGSEVSRLYTRGMIAGVLGAAVVALWFLLLDAAHGRPFYTPTVLGTALFGRSADLTSPDQLRISVEMVTMFTWVHGLVFAALGALASRLLGVAERNPSLGFGVVLLFVVFQFAFTVAAMLFAAPVLHVLTWPAVFGANLLSAAVMTAYLWYRSPTLHVSP